MAKRLRKLLQLTGYVVSLMVGLFIYTCRHLILEFYTTVDEVKEMSDEVLKFLAFFHILDAA